MGILRGPGKDGYGRPVPFGRQNRGRRSRDPVQGPVACKIVEPEHGDAIDSGSGRAGARSHAARQKQRRASK
jgi:hypothetical protein